MYEKKKKHQQKQNPKKQPQQQKLPVKQQKQHPKKKPQQQKLTAAYPAASTCRQVVPRRREVSGSVRALVRVTLRLTEIVDFENIVAEIITFFFFFL